MLTISSIKELQHHILSWKAAGCSIALVPTMGMLHNAHISLVETASKLADKIIVSVYVNPTQFGPNEDFNLYPRNISQDSLLLKNSKCDLMFAPSSEEMYPDNFASSLYVEHLMDVLCAHDRPTHFKGVLQIVSKLCNICSADVAVFGEKDWQQLIIIHRLFEDLNHSTRIIGSPIVREHDGLAVSSRNLNLTPIERNIANNLNLALHMCAQKILEGNDIEDTCKAYYQYLISSGFRNIHYLEVLDEQNLLPAHQPLTGRERIFVAADIGKVRLIDNMRLTG